MQAETPVADGIDIEQLYEFVIALRNGRFDVRLPVPETGRAREVAMHLNRHMENMGQVVSEVTRVAIEVGVEGRLGPQAEGAFGSGPWHKMVEAVNLLAGNVTDNVRDLVWTIDALNKEGRFRKVHTECQGEWLGLKSGVNALVERLKAQAAAPVQAQPAPPTAQS
jgi:hypothetical protein